MSVWSASSNLLFWAGILLRGNDDNDDDDGGEDDDNTLGLQIDKFDN
jgi:hypothetical protein